MARDLVPLLGEASHHRGVEPRNLTQHEERGTRLVFAQHGEKTVDVSFDAALESATARGADASSENGGVVVLLHVHAECVDYHPGTLGLNEVDFDVQRAPGWGSVGMRVEGRHIEMRSPRANRSHAVSTARLATQRNKGSLSMRTSIHSPRSAVR